MEFTEQPKQARIHVPNFEQFKGAGESEKLDYKTEVDEWTPSFDDLPDWVAWVAQDSSGGWNGYDEDKPFWKRGDYDDGFEWLTVGNYMFIRETPLHPHGWKNTLTKRPEKRSERVSVEGKVNVSVEDMQAIIDAHVDNDKERGGSNPTQYSTPCGNKDLQDLIEYRNMNFAIGNIFKACYRMGVCGHSDELRDINKIIWFANRERDRILKDKDG